MRWPFSLNLAALSFGLSVFSPYSGFAQDTAVGERKVVSRQAPVYPELARKLHLGGVVKIEVVVGLDGKMKSTHVLGGSPVLVQAAVDAVSKWRWAPNSEETKELVEFNFH